MASSFLKSMAEQSRKKKQEPTKVYGEYSQKTGEQHITKNETAQQVETPTAGESAQAPRSTFSRPSEYTSKKNDFVSRINSMKQYRTTLDTKMYNPSKFDETQMQKVGGENWQRDIISQMNTLDSRIESMENEYAAFEKGKNNPSFYSKPSQDFALPNANKKTTAPTQAHKLLGGDDAAFSPAPKLNWWDELKSDLYYKIHGNDSVGAEIKEGFSGTDDAGEAIEKTGWSPKDWADVGKLGLKGAKIGEGNTVSIDTRYSGAIKNASNVINELGTAQDNATIGKDLEEAKYSWQVSPLKALGSNVNSGFQQVGASIAEFAKMLGADNIPIVDTLIENTISAAKEAAETSSRYNKGVAGQVVGTVSQGLVSMTPYVILGLMSGGATLAAKLGSSASKAGTALLKLAKNPAFLYSLLSTTGGEYQQALDGGANEASAIKNALMVSLPSALIEIGGGLGADDALTQSVMRTTIDEVIEEISQDFFSNLGHKSTFEPNMPIYATDTSENALINPAKMAQTAALTAVTAGIAGGGMKAANMIMNPTARDVFDAGAQGLSFEQVQTAAPAIVRQLGEAEAYKAWAQGQHSVAAQESTIDMAQDIDSDEAALERNEDLITEQKVGTVATASEAATNARRRIFTRDEVLATKTESDEFAPFDDDVNSALDNNEVRQLQFAKKTVKSGEAANSKIALEGLIEDYGAEIHEFENEISDYVNSYKPQGVVINQETGTRYSQNDQWYRDFYRKNGKAPSKQEKAAIIRGIIGGEITSPVEPPQNYKQIRDLYLAADSAYSKVFEIGHARDYDIDESGAVWVIDDNAPGASATTANTEQGKGVAVAQNQPAQEVSGNTASSRLSQDDIVKIKHIGEKLGVSVEVGESADKNGWYDKKTRTIHVSTNSKMKALALLGHEFTHSLEGTKSYAKLKKFVLNSYELRKYTQDRNCTVTDLAQAKRAYYSEQGVELTPEQAENEVVSDFIGSQLFTDEKTIYRLARTDMGTAQRVLAWVNDTIRLLGRDAEVKELINAQRLYRKAIAAAQKENTTAKNGDVKYSIMESDTQGKVAFLDENSIDRQPGESFSHAARRFFNERFKGTEVRVKEYGDNVTLDQIGKYLHPGYLPKNSMQKGQALNVLDAMIAIATNKSHEKDIYQNGAPKKHGGLDTAGGFDYYDTKFAVDNSGTIWNGRVVCRIDKNGKPFFYDLDNIRAVAQQTVNKFKSEVGLSTAPIDSNISQNNNGVNSQYMQNDGKNGTETKFSIGEDFEQEYNQLIEKYGKMKKGENPTRDVDVPRKTDSGKVRQFARTAIEAEGTTTEVASRLQREIVRGTFAYEPIGDKSALERAVKIIETTGEDNAVKSWLASTSGNNAMKKEDIALGEQLYINAAQNGNVELATTLAAEIAAEATRAGQIVQAMRLLKKMSGAGQLYYARKAVENLNKDLHSERGRKAPILKIDPKLAEDLGKAETESDIENAVDTLMQDVANQIPATLSDKWNAWRYFAMLGNPRTHIRNLAGNGIFVPAVMLKNVIASGIESSASTVKKVFSAKPMQRSKTLKTSLPFTGGEYKKFAVADFAEMRDIISGGGKLNPTDMVRDRQKIFKFRMLEWARRQNFNLLEREDGIFLKAHYVRAMTQYLAANKITPSDLNNSLKGMQALEKARKYAIEEAQKATYRDASKMASGLSKFARSNKIAGLALEGLLPFKKTPINILKRGIEYSPVGFLDTVTRGIGKLKSGKITSTEFIDKIAANLSGSLIMAFGAWLASVGLLSGGGDDEKKKDKFDKMLGSQSYALQVGETNYTLDWAAPVSLPLFIGVEMWNQLDNGEITFTKLFDSLKQIAEPMFNMSMLAGLNNTFNNAANGDNPIWDISAGVGTNYLGQAVPTLLGQIARTIDPTRRTTSPDKTVDLPTDAQYFINKQKNKIPGLSFSSEPYVDAWGRTESDPDTAMRALQNFISPGYISTKKATSVDMHIEELYDKLGDVGVLPSVAPKYFTVDAERVDLTAKEYTQFATTRGQTAFNAIEGLVSLEEYERLDDAAKGRAIKSVYDYASQVSKSEIREYTPEKWVVEAQEGAENYGMPVEQYICMRTEINLFEPWRDEDGETIRNSTSLRKRELIDKTVSGAARRNYLYGAFDVSETVRKFSSGKVKQDVGRAQAKAK